MNAIPSTHRAAQRGQVMVIALGVLTVMALIAGSTLMAISSRYKTALRTAAWEEALLTAESGVDMTVAQLAGLLPDVQLNSGGVALGTSTPSLALVTGLKLEPGGLNLANGVTVSLTPDPLIHAGEGATTSSATVSIDVLPLDQVLNGQLLSGVLGLLSANQPAAINLLRLRSKGIVQLPGTSRAADVSKLDAKLFRAALVRDPATGQKVTRPFVAREIEVLLKPVFPFEHGVATDGPLEAPSALARFDSFNSASPLASTNGLFDSSKRREKIEVRTNGAEVTLGGTVHGDVFTNGSNLVKDAHITGRVNNAYFRALPAVAAPTWTATSTAVTGTKTITAGSLLSPARQKFSQVTGTINVKANVVSGLGGLLGGVPVVGDAVSSQVDIYVTGDFRGRLIVDPGVKVRLYVGGNVEFAANALQNLGQRAASVQILGLPPSDGTTRAMSIDTTGNPIAAIYAPTHEVTLGGDGSFSGAISAARLRLPGNSAIHFDEALALESGLVLGYQLVSWKEIQTP
jgi:hypothetical protein